MNDRLYFLIEYHMGHSALEEERVNDRDRSTGLVHAMGWNVTLTGDDVVHWAVAELDAGQTSDALARLASVREPATWRDVVELFRAAYTDLGYDKFSKQQHLLGHLKDIAICIIDGSMAPMAGCRYLWKIGEHLDFPAPIGFQVLDFLLAGCHPDTKVPLDEPGLHREIIQYARSIVDETSCRAAARDDAMR